MTQQQLKRGDEGDEIQALTLAWNPDIKSTQDIDHDAQLKSAGFNQDASCITHLYHHLPTINKNSFQFLDVL